MTKTFTEHDLIRYLYHETTEKEGQAINDALICDSELMAMYNELCAVKANLDTVKLEPSPRAVLNILSYARGHKVKNEKK